MATERFEMNFYLSNFKESRHNQFKFFVNGDWVLNKEFTFEFDAHSNSILNNYFQFEREDTCAICLSEFQQHEDYQKYFSCEKCKKEFGVKCILKWIGQGKNSCPCCRTEILKTNNRTDEWFNLPVLEYNFFVRLDN